VNRLVRRRPSPATIISLLALFVALSGTGYAAVVLAPKNSVNSASVVNGSLEKVDLSKKAVATLEGNRGSPGAQGLKGDTGAQGPTGGPGAQGSKGDPGAQGPKGDTGAAGPRGEKGETGARGPEGIQGAQGDTGPRGVPGEPGQAGQQGRPGIVDAYSHISDVGHPEIFVGYAAGTFLDLPAGNWFVQGTATSSKNAGDTVHVGCRITDAAGKLLGIESVGTLPGPGLSRLTLPIAAPVTLEVPGRVTLKCTRSGEFNEPSVYLILRQLTAIRIDNQHTIYDPVSP
jgi:hypothetical protein